MRRLWLHRDLENLQNRISCYLFSPHHILERQRITQDWQIIKADMDKALDEMDMEVLSKKLYDTDRKNALQDNSGQPK